jgi:hypothetical protein
VGSTTNAGETHPYIPSLPPFYYPKIDFISSLISGIDMNHSSIVRRGICMLEEGAVVILEIISTIRVLRVAWIVGMNFGFNEVSFYFIFMRI